MRRLKFGVLIVAVSLISLNIAISFAQEKTEPKEQAANQPVLDATDTLWLWGEVSVLNPENKQITVKYLDYDTDNEKEINITVDDKTTYEYVKALNEIKLQDTVSVDYVLGPQDKYIAKNISVEKPDETVVPSAAETATAPEGTEIVPADLAVDTAAEPVQN